MIRNGFEFLFRRTATAAVTAFALVVAGGCSLSTSPDNKPSVADITIEGTSPNPLFLIISKDFYEQYNTGTGEYKPIIITSDTVEITPPHSQTVDISLFGSVYVELYQPEAAVASVNMKVNLDNGEHYEQNANMSDGAQLIYYFVFSNYGF